MENISLMLWNWQKSDWTDWRFDAGRLAALESQFLLQAGHLTGVWRHMESDARTQTLIDLLSDEAVDTSEIEGEHLDRASVQSSIRREFGLQTDTGAGPAERGIAALMLDCHNGFGDELTHETLFRWHEHVCAGRGDLAVIGGYRTHKEAMQVVSGPIQKRKIHFEAPPSAAMHDEMSRFIEWYATTELSALTKAGLAHLYFASIHPFEDGNGRIARALCEKTLAQALGAPSLTTLSRQIMRQRKGYYVSLEANNKGAEVTDWLIWFAEATLAAQKYSLDMIDHLMAKTRMLDRLRGQLNPRQTKAMIRIFDAGPEGFLGGLSAKNYISITGAAAATARRDLGYLVDKGALERTGERKGTRYWLANLDRWA